MLFKDSNVFHSLYFLQNQTAKEQHIYEVITSVTNFKHLWKKSNEWNRSIIFENGFSLNLSFSTSTITDITNDPKTQSCAKYPLNKSYKGSITI